MSNRPESSQLLSRRLLSPAPDHGRNLQNAITEIIAESPDLDQAIIQVIQSVCECTGWDFGEIWDFDASAQVLVHRADWVPTSVRFPKFQEISRQITFSPGSGLPGRVWKNVQALWIPDVVEDVNFPRASFAAREGLHAGVGLPLRARNKVIGVMSFFSQTTRPPDNELLTVFEMVGRHIGLFIERQMLQHIEHEHIQQEAALQERLRIAQSLRSVTLGNLFPAAITAETLPYLWDSNQNKLWYALKEVRQAIQLTLTESQSLLTELLAGSTLGPGPRQLLSPLVEKYAAQARDLISLTVHGEYSLSTDVQVAVYCITQEALQNVIQHARATSIAVGLSSHEFGGELTISDNGKGFDPNLVLPDRLGLRIMRGCSANVGGNLSVTSVLGQGTKVILSWRNSRETKPVR